MRRAFAAVIAAMLYGENTGDGLGSLLVFIAVVAAIGSARKVDE